MDTNTLEVQGSPIRVEGEAGVGKIKIPAGSPGLKKYGGIIKVMGADGTYRTYPFNSEYIVGTPSATISPIKTNVFYIGVDNPISVYVAGVPNEDVNVAISGGGTITKTGNGLYNVRVSKAGEVMINVSAKSGESYRAMGSMKFICKRIPNPVPYVGGISGGIIAKSTLLSSGGLIPKMDGFEFEAYFSVTSFTMSVCQPSGITSLTSSGAKFTPQMVSLLNKTAKGQKVYIEDIKAKGPDGEVRSLSSIALTIN